MKGMPATLRGRISLYIGLLMVVSQVVWFGGAKVFFVKPVKDSYKQQIGDIISMAQALVESRLNQGDPTRENINAFPELKSLKVVAAAEPGPRLEVEREDDFVRELSDILKRRYGPTALVREEKDHANLWIRFPGRGRLFWLVIPFHRAVTLPFSVLVLISASLAISVIGAHLIIFRLTQQLRNVTEAAQAVGRDELPDALAETGPLEVRDLSMGFNKMAADLKKLDSERRLMLAGISHDLRTPLTRLRIAVELAGARAEPAIAAGMVRDIEDMDSILKQFLDYARDGSEEQPESGDLDAIVRDVCRRYAGRGDSVEVNLGNVPAFAFRRLAIRRAITNLVDNAVRYGGGVVQVKTRIEETAAFVTVSDQGPGIRSGKPADFIKPFAREDVSRSESGAGLGLTIVDRVMQMHGGKLRLVNQPAGGLLASIELPLAFVAAARS